jgi:outer membrane protein assembly factor BamA
MITSSIELRMPSPFMADVVRTAVFLDAGHVSAPGVELFSTTGIRFTPGVGIRFLTPVGPFRMDLAYNPYIRDPGPLYSINPRIGLVLIDHAYQPDPPGFFGSFRIQFALGQAF